MAETPDIKAYFNTLAEKWNKNYSDSILFSERLEKIIRLTSDIPLKDKTVLDIGCGSGMISAHFSGKGASVYGIDISENMIQQADAFVQSRNMKAEFSIGDAANLQFPDKHFDLITCISVIEWMDEDRNALLEIKRVLKPNGIAIMSVPNQTSWLRKAETWVFKSKKLLSVFFNFRTGYLAFQKHQYDPRKFDALCREANLKTIDSTYYVTPFSKFSFFRKLSRFRWIGMMYFVKLQKIGD